MAPKEEQKRRIITRGLAVTPHRREYPSPSERFSGHGSNLGHFSDVSVGRGDHHRVVRSIQRFSLRTFSLGDPAKGREQDRPRVESIRAAPTDRVETAAERLSQARRREAYI